MFTLWFDANANEEQKQIIPEAARRKKKTCNIRHTKEICKLKLQENKRIRNPANLDYCVCHRQVHTNTHTRTQVLLCKIYSITAINILIPNNYPGSPTLKQLLMSDPPAPPSNYLVYQANDLREEKKTRQRRGREKDEGRSQRELETPG